jgi:hypothetical protein
MGIERGLYDILEIKKTASEDEMLACGDACLQEAHSATVEL